MNNIYFCIASDELGSEEMLKPNDKVRIKGTCIVGSIARINKDICIFHDEEIDKFIKMETNKLEGIYE